MAKTNIIDDKDRPESKMPASGGDPNEPHLLFSKTNYLIVLVGVAFIAIGFILMAGGGSKDPTVFDAEAIYSFRRITLAPILVLIGFAIEIVAILKKP